MILIHHLFDPVVGAIVLLLGALVASHYRRAALARGFVIATTLFLLAVLLLPLDALVAKPLEEAYPRPSQLPSHVDGIVVLSGGIVAGIEATRNAPTDNGTFLRMMAAASLAQRYPEARLIFSGTSGGSARARETEFAIIERTFRMFGVPAGRTIYERKSQNTWEDLNFSHGIAHPKVGETWILVTSAVHMRRSMGVARRIGWTMVPWASDYDTADTLEHQPILYASRRMVTLTEALHEWLGLAAYWVQGRLA